MLLSYPKLIYCYILINKMWSKKWLKLRENVFYIRDLEGAVIFINIYIYIYIYKVYHYNVS